jgi:hypothetical protein
VALAAVVTGAGWLGDRGPFLVVEDGERQHLLHRERVSAGQAFVLSYVHSSEGVPVRGLFRIEADGTLTLTETQFAGFGPGLPALGPGDTWALEDGMIVARGHDRMAEMRMRVAPITRHHLYTPAGRDLDLSALLGGSGAVRIRVR